VENGGRGWI